MVTENLNRWHVIANAQTWMEGEALAQLRNSSHLPGMLQVVGLPDLHPGKNAPIGAVYLNADQIYPHLVGNDIGCGMALWQSPLLKRKKKPERWLKKLQGLEEPWTGDSVAWLKAQAPAQDWSDEVQACASALGTIGGGNHFAELQEIAQIYDSEALNTAGIQPEQLLLLVHSGSRGLGEAILRHHLDHYGAQGLPADSEAATQYLQAHDVAVTWARANRALIAQRFLSCLGESLSFEQGPLLDLCHNAVWHCAQGWLHRKGAAPADQGLAVIPGSRGAYSYLVRPCPSAPQPLVSGPRSGTQVAAL